MKKYLMTGVAALAFAATFTSCSNHDGTEYNPQAQVKDTYKAAFIKAFGQPASNQDWGFGTVRKAGTRSVDVNSNEWAAKGYVVPAAITPREKEVVMDWFAKNKNPQSETVDIHNYFVQNVGHGGQNYTCKDGNGATHEAVGSNQMDWIFCGPGYYLNEWEGMTEPAPLTENNGDEHINNFNANSGNIQHILWTGSTYFGFHDSFQDNGSGSKYSTVNRNFVLRFIDVDGVVGCYVGFDYESHGGQGDINPDGYFNDRVIKLIPGNGTWPSGYETRIMAEDLSAASDGDFDFNDVVFDVKFNSATTATVRIVAAGGTLPLYVSAKDADHEVHKMFADANPDANIVLPTTSIKGTMINTNASGGIDNLNPVIFDVSGIDRSQNGRDIKIWVTKEVNGEDVDFELTAVEGEPAAKFAVKPTFVYCKERKPIKGSFPYFIDWVTTAENVKWYYDTTGTPVEKN